MQTQSIIITYEDHPINLELNGELMINASEMAAIFGRPVERYTRTESTKEFVKALCQSYKSSFEQEFTTNGRYVKTIVGGRSAGTWMHRIVALDFAAWLDPNFRIWAWQQIDQLLFQQTNTRKSYYEKRAELFDQLQQVQSQINQLKQNLHAKPEWIELGQLKEQRKKIVEKLGGTDREVFGRQLTIGEQADN